jgi:hypothetical protein
MGQLSIVFDDLERSLILEMVDSFADISPAHEIRTWDEAATRQYPFGGVYVGPFPYLSVIPFLKIAHVAITFVRLWELLQAYSVRNWVL